MRRSLIDCAEKPLRRRSTTPSDGTPEEVEEWPAIEPTKSELNLATAQNSSQIKPSLSESLYKGMCAVKLNYDHQNNVQGEDKHQVADAFVEEGEKEFVNSNAAGTEELLSDGKSRPFSSSQVPKPRDSMMQSLSRHMDAPVVRHTKSSTLRLQQAAGKSLWEANHRNKSVTTPTAPFQERAASPSYTNTKQDSTVTHTRTNSRGRHGVTARGSPYTIASRGLSNRKQGIRNETSVHVFANTIGDRVVGREAKRSSVSPPRKLRKSTVPLPARVVRQSAKFEDQRVGEAPVGPPAALSTTNDQLPNAVNDASGSGPATHDGAADTPVPRHTSDTARLVSVREDLSTPGPDETQSFVDTEEDNSGSSTHGFDSFGGYRVKHLGNNDSKIGPTLRITDSASRVLLGDRHESNSPATQSPATLRHRGSAPNVGSPRIVKDRQRSSGVFNNIPRPMSFVRNVADRLTSQCKLPDDEEARKLIDTSDSLDFVVRAEPSGIEGTEAMDFVADSLSDFRIAPSIPAQRTGNQGTPKSDHGDWPGKQFADYDFLARTSSILSKRYSATDVVAEPGFRRPINPPPPKSPPRPPTIILREPPTEETAPFLFQDMGEEQAKQQKLMAGDIVNASKSSKPWPSRESSRRPKPPPIYVSAPGIDYLSAHPAPKAYAIQPEVIKKPRNVKTFSQSVSRHTSSVKGRKISGVLSNSPSPSNKKKVVSSLRGLFHKMSSESTKAGGATIAGSKGDMDSLPTVPAVGYEYMRAGHGSFRRKQLPTFTVTESDSHEKKVGNPTRQNSTSLSVTGLRKSTNEYPTVSPTTPWTVTQKTPPYPPSSYPTASDPANQALTHGHPSTSLYSAHSSPTLSPPSGTSSPILSIATRLTHDLLDLARTENHTTKKSHLIELSKCMVEVVSSARDAEKAMEKAKMEASRAEVSYLKCSKEVSKIEEMMRDILAQNQREERVRVKEV